MTEERQELNDAQIQYRPSGDEDYTPEQEEQAQLEAYYYIDISGKQKEIINSYYISTYE